MEPKWVSLVAVGAGRWKELLFFFLLIFTTKKRERGENASHAREQASAHSTNGGLHLKSYLHLITRPKTCSCCCYNAIRTGQGLGRSLFAQRRGSHRTRSARGFHGKQVECETLAHTTLGPMRLLVWYAAATVQCTAHAMKRSAIHLFFLICFGFLSTIGSTQTYVCIF